MENSILATHLDVWNSHFLTGRPSFEVVVVLRDVGKNAQPVWDP